MELRDLRAFVSVAEAGGFRRAAQYQPLDGSVISRRVRTLEDELGVSLFERNRVGVRLTGAGRRFLTDIRVVISHLEAAVRTASAAGYAGEGLVKIGVVASVSSSFPNRLIRTFKAEFPEVVLDIVEGSYGEHVTSIRASVLDPLDANFNAVVDKEVDGESSLPARMEANPSRRISQLQAATRAARAVFICSAPLAGRPNAGLTGPGLRLACAEPGDQLAIFGDAVPVIAAALPQHAPVRGSRRAAPRNRS